MSLRSPRPLTIVALALVLVVGLAVVFVLNLVLPQAKFVAIVLGVLVVVGTVGAAHYSVGRRWVGWLGIPAAGLFGIGTMMLSEDIGLDRAGERVEAVVVDHSVEVHEGAKGKSYTHHYSLENADGRPLDEPMLFRGKGGFDGVDEGTTIEVLVDPDGEVPTKPADSVDFGADIAALVVGFLAVIGVFGACAIRVARRPVRTR